MIKLLTDCFWQICEHIVGNKKVQHRIKVLEKRIESSVNSTPLGIVVFQTPHITTALSQRFPKYRGGRCWCLRYEADAIRCQFCELWNIIFWQNYAFVQLFLITHQSAIWADPTTVRMLIHSSTSLGRKTKQWQWIIIHSYSAPVNLVVHNYLFPRSRK